MNKTYYAQINEEAIRETLPNGLNVILIPKQEMAQTYGVFTTDYGSIDQTFVPIDRSDYITVPDGIAHFLEHKMFEKEDRDVFQDFTTQGASANAFTSFTKTAYLFSSTNNLKENTEILLDFVQDPYFSEASVEKEKGIIAQEIQMYNDQPDWRAFFGLIETMYESHPVKIDIAGTIDSIQSITKDDLYTCYHTFYHPSNMTFTLVGSFEPEDMLTFIKNNQDKKTFESLSEIKREYPNEPESVATSERVIHMPVNMSRCMVGIKDHPETDPERFLEKELLAELILDFFYSKSGEYYQELYDLNLIDGSIGFESERQKQFAFSIVGGNTTDADQFGQVVKRQFESFKNYTMSESDFERMKRKMVGELLSDLNDVSSIANEASQYEMLGLDYFNIIPTLESLTVEKANDFLNSWVTDSNVAVFKVKPLSENE
ncbi:Predicted Zn-dependent peptidase [Pelagirhabdus alkalitolerans]|uniref:Predicted Zn-dependent peptidase n=1 Tax=Pelagirhabdus alkalitolerans TaxID=1612202 RepID=A0A1G6H537_9BACI|nr:pitrilysin family protein [Pelagirhabdus alkalitolerans]SDB89218.1 Predicted Zn-dependent peptidase [Pelagirhabdus alkalitolerans]